MPYVCKERKREHGRLWNAVPRDGRCEAIVGGPFYWRCPYNGFYEGLPARILCGTHLRKFERGGELVFDASLIASATDGSAVLQEPSVVPVPDTQNRTPPKSAVAQVNHLLLGEAEDITKPTRVTALDQNSGVSESVEIFNDYVIVCDGACSFVVDQVLDNGGTHIIRVTGRDVRK